MTRRKCFVIMPFGDKLNIDRSLIDAFVTSAAQGVAIDPSLINTIDFDAVYDRIITKAVEASKFDLEAIRCDEIPGAGSIHADMFTRIYQDDVVVVDISTLNANVFYELGVRHSLKRNVTVLIQRRGTVAPFNIRGFRVIEYDERADPMSAVAEIAHFIDEGLGRTDRNDSPVYLHLPEIEVRRKIQVIDTTKRIEYRLRARPDTTIGLITGDIQNIKEIDVWVNSENTNMQMARFHDIGVSGVIRWLGAKKKQNGRVAIDVIAEELRELMEGDSEVDAGTVMVTGSGELVDSHGVRLIFHAAAVDGQVGRGYRPIEEVGACIRSALGLMDHPKYDSYKLRTILFPLLGAGRGGRSIDDSMAQLISTCLAHLDTRPNSRIKGVYIIARTSQHLDARLTILDRTAGLERLV
ncbi:MAG: macro domain-containing protein [Pseudomonadota bacterium]